MMKIYTLLVTTLLVTTHVNAIVTTDPVFSEVEIIDKVPSIKAILTHASNLGITAENCAHNITAYGIQAINESACIHYKNINKKYSNKKFEYYLEFYYNIPKHQHTIENWIPTLRMIHEDRLYINEYIK